MKLNVAIGDLVMIIGINNNAGAIGKVCSYHGDLKDQITGYIAQNTWLIEFPRSIKARSPKTGETLYVPKAYVKDSALRKIAGPDVISEKEKEALYA